MSKLTHSHEPTMRRIDTRAAIDGGNRDIVLDELTPTQRRILDNLRHGPSTLGRQTKSIRPLLDMDLIGWFRRDYLFRKHNPRVYHLTDLGQALLSPIGTKGTGDE